jgi:hypothetical protein
LGGSLIVMNLDRQLSFSYAMNKLAGRIIGSDRGKKLHTRAGAVLAVILTSFS